MLNFKLSEFLQVLLKMVRLLNDVLVELRAIRRLLEESARPQYHILSQTDWQNWTCVSKCETHGQEDES